MQYTLRGEFRVPYFDTRVRFEVAMDAVTKAQRLSYYEGLVRIRSRLLRMFGKTFFLFSYCL
jgi:hypothetical protein